MADVDKKFFLEAISRADDGITVITKNAFEEGILEDFTPKKVLEAIAEFNSGCKEKGRKEERVPIVCKEKDHFIYSEEKAATLVENNEWELPYEAYGLPLGSLDHTYKERFKMGPLLPDGDMDLMSHVSAVSFLLSLLQS